MERFLLENNVARTKAARVTAVDTVMVRRDMD